MKRKLRFVPRPAYEVSTTPFASAEEAWFWFIRCQRVRREGVQFSDGSSETMRPCDPDDVYRAIMTLLRNRKIGGEHLQVLGVFGLEERPPDPRRRDEERPARLWDEALDRLATVLRRKGIIE